MGSLFDVGRPTGIIGGVHQAEVDRLNKTEQDIDIKRKQAEFFDYMDGIEQRAVERDRKIVEDRATIETKPSEVEADISGNKLATAQNKVNLEDLPKIREQRLRSIKENATRQNLDNFGQYYKSIQHSLEAGQNPVEVYTRYRQMVLDTSINPEEAKKTYEIMGIEEQYSPKAMMGLLELTNIGAHDPATTRAEHLAAEEWAFRIAEARSSAGPKRDKKTHTADLKTDEIARQLESISAFADLNGGWDKDQGTYVGEKAAAAATVARVANSVTDLFPYADEKVSAEQVAGVIMELWQEVPQVFSTPDKINTWGGKFNAAPLEGMSYYILNSISAAMRANPNLEFNALWRKNKKDAIAQAMRIYDDRATSQGGILNIDPGKASQKPDSFMLDIDKLSGGKAVANPELRGAVGDADYYENLKSQAATRQAAKQVEEKRLNQLELQLYERAKSGKREDIMALIRFREEHNR